MSDISNITTAVRYLINDVAKTQIPGDVFSYGSSAVFTLSESNIIDVSTVKVNDVALSSGDWAFDSTDLTVTVSSALVVGDTIEIQYSYYPNYSDAEIESYIRAAVIYLSVHNYYTFEVDTSDNFYPEITDAEKNLISLIASILIKPDNKTIRLPDMTISVPNSLPTRDLISKAIRIFKQNTHGYFTLT